MSESTGGGGGGVVGGANSAETTAFTSEDIQSQLTASSSEARLAVSPQNMSPNDGFMSPSSSGDSATISNSEDNEEDLFQSAAQDVSHFVRDTIQNVADSVETQFTNSEDDSVGYVLNSQNEWGWITLYSVTLSLAILLNLLVILGGMCTRRTRNTGHYLLINLSIRDFLMAALCLPFALDSEILSLTWNFGPTFCICYRYFYYCFLFFLPLTLLFLSWHLFVENCKWNFAGEEGVVPRPWTHTIYIPIIWFLSAAFAVPTVFFSEVRSSEEDIYRNEIVRRPPDSTVCMHRGGEWKTGSLMFYATSHLLTFVLPVILLVIPWLSLAVQMCGCCTRKLRSPHLFLSLKTVFLILIFELSRSPLELFNIHYVLQKWTLIGPIQGPLIPGIDDSESYRAVMKWAVFAPCLVNPMLHLLFSPEFRHGLCIFFSRVCSCCCSSKDDGDLEMGSDDEKGMMLLREERGGMGAGSELTPTSSGGMVVSSSDQVPLQSKREDEM